jgi:small subunit ribosomal protein S4e
MHKTRSEMPKEWPIVRKGTKYVAVTSHDGENSIPILFVLRDILKLAQTKKEAQFILRSGDVKIDNKVRKEEHFPVQAFSTISLEKTGKNYRLLIENGKFDLREITAKEAERKIVKIIGKRMKNKDIQMNLEDGQNFLIKEKFALGDSAVVNTKERKVEKILALKEGAGVKIISGRYSGEKGKIKEIRLVGKNKAYVIKLKDKEVSIPLETFFVIE